MLEDFLNYNFTAIDKKDVKSYAKCFWETKECRLEKFIGNVVSYCEISPSILDFSEESLEVLDRWLLNHVKCVKLTKEEYELKREHIPDYIDIDDWRFSDDTFSNIINVGLYLGEVMIHKHPDLKWEQYLKKTVDYGQVIIRIGKIGMNPMRLVNTTCYKVADNRQKSLLEIVQVWEEFL
jgi:hypothetical protein